MTTTVKIDAHCYAATTEVQIIDREGKIKIIQDGESHEVHVYDACEVTVREVLKVSAAE